MSIKKWIAMPIEDAERLLMNYCRGDCKVCTFSKMCTQIIKEWNGEASLKNRRKG